MCIFTPCSGFLLQSDDTQSTSQKLQLRVPSMESLFRSPLTGSLFRSASKESLVRTSSRDSLNRLDLDFAATFDPSSDMESETEDSLSSLDSLNREQLVQWLRRMERRLNSYKGKCSEVGAWLFGLYKNLFSCSVLHITVWLLLLGWLDRQFPRHAGEWWVVCGHI